MMAEWSRRGYDNTKTREHLARLLGVPEVSDAVITGPPPWVTPRLIRSHMSHLIRTQPTYYGPLFEYLTGRQGPSDLEYVWPK